MAKALTFGFLTLKGLEDESNRPEDLIRTQKKKKINKKKKKKEKQIAFRNSSKKKKK